MANEEKEPKYLYHKQKMEQEEAATPVPRKARATKAPHAGQHYFMNNLRTFLLVFVSMIILLALAYFITTRSSNVQKARYQKQIEELQLREEAREASRRKLVNSLIPGDEPEENNAAEVMIGQSRKQDLDTKAIAKAVYLSKRANVLRDAENYEAAIAEYKNALHLWPYLGQVWADLGEAYLLTKDYPRAQIALKRAAQNIPNDAEILGNLGLTFLYQQDPESALDIFQAALEIDPKFGKNHYHIALCHISNEAFTLAAESLTEYFKFNPKDPKALREMAVLEAQRSRYDRSLDFLKKALAEAPDSPNLYFEAAASSALLGRAEDAIRYLEKGEAFTDPHRAYKAYMSPAFNEVRLSGLGRIYEQELADRARRTIKEQSKVL